MGRPRRDASGRRGSGTGRGVGRPPGVRRETESTDRLQRLEDRLTALAGLVQQLVQQQIPATAAPTPPVSPPNAEPEGQNDVPVDLPDDPAPPPVVITPMTAIASGNAPGAAAGSDPPSAVRGPPLPPQPVTPVTVTDDQAEKTRLKAVLMEFKRFKPRVFLGKNDDHWAVEQWIDHMEKLFRNFFTEERDKVLVAAHFLEEGASKW